MEQWKRIAFSSHGMEAHFRMDRLRNGFLLCRCLTARPRSRRQSPRFDNRFSCSHVNGCQLTLPQRALHAPPAPAPTLQKMPISVAAGSDDARALTSASRHPECPQRVRFIATLKRAIGSEECSALHCSVIVFGHLVGDRVWERHLDAEARQRLLVARIVCWVDVIDAPRADELHLENSLLISGPGIVRVLCRIYPQGARL